MKEMKKMNNEPCKIEVNEFLTTVFISKETFLLVEGKTDLDVITKLFLNHEINTSNVYTSDMIEGEKGHKIREKIKYLCLSYKKKAKKNLFGLIDREYDSFEFNKNGVKDNTPKHKCINECVFFTRGHSIENYFFQKKVLTIFLKEVIRNIKHKEIEKISNIYFEKIVLFLLKISIFSKKLNNELNIPYSIFKKIKANDKEKYLEIINHEINFK